MQPTLLLTPQADGTFGCMFTLMRLGGQSPYISNYYFTYLVLAVLRTILIYICTRHLTALPTNVTSYHFITLGLHVPLATMSQSAHGIQPTILFSRIVGWQSFRLYFTLSRKVVNHLGLYINATINCCTTFLVVTKSIYYCYFCVSLPNKVNLRYPLKVKHPSLLAFALWHPVNFDTL